MKKNFLMFYHMILTTSIRAFRLLDLDLNKINNIATNELYFNINILFGIT